MLLDSWKSDSYQDRKIEERKLGLLNDRNISQSV